MKNYIEICSLVVISHIDSFSFMFSKIVILLAVLKVFTSFLMFKKKEMH